MKKPPRTNPKWLNINPQVQPLLLVLFLCFVTILTGLFIRHKYNNFFDTKNKYLFHSTKILKINVKNNYFLRKTPIYNTFYENMFYSTKSVCNNCYLCGMKTDRIDLDLDVMNLMSKLHDGESLFYFRSDGENISLCFKGERGDLIRSFVDCMDQEEHLAEVIQSAALNFAIEE